MRTTKQLTAKRRGLHLITATAVVASILASPSEALAADCDVLEPHPTNPAYVECETSVCDAGTSTGADCTIEAAGQLLLPITYTFTNLGVERQISTVYATVDEVRDSPTGVVRSTVSTINTVSGSDGSPPTNYKCHTIGSDRSDVEIREWYPLEYSDDGIYVSYVVHEFGFPHARKISGTWRTQMQSCMVGGAVARNGWRLYVVGAGYADTDTNKTWRLAGDWSSGRDITTASASLGFEVAKVAGISASMSQGSVGDNKGALGRGYTNLGFDQWERNAVHSWWNEVCGWQTPKSNCGSQDWQASVTLSLYEYPETEAGAAEHAAIVYFGRRCTTRNNVCNT